MKIVAIMCVRNEIAYMKEVLTYLSNEDIDVVVIDNDSEDGTVEAVLGGGFSNLIAIERLPFCGSFDLSAQLNAKALAIESVEADWIIHQDADEILQSPNEWGGLRKHIEIADSHGFNVLNFNEMVMLPSDPGLDDFIRNNSNFYFFEPRPLRLMRAWKKSSKLFNLHSGGHVLEGGDVIVYPERMILKHFIVRNQRHALEKYLGRSFSPSDLGKGWHGNRLNFNHRNLIIPVSGRDLHRLEDPKQTPSKLPRSTPAHFWEWPQASE